MSTGNTTTKGTDWLWTAETEGAWQKHRTLRVNEFSQREALRAWSRVKSAHLDTATGFTTHKPLWLWNAICKMGTEISSGVAVKSDCISVLCLPQSLTECSWFWIFGSGYHHFIWGLWPTGWNIPVVQKRVPKIKPSEKHLKQPGWFNLDRSGQGGGTMEHLTLFSRVQKSKGLKITGRQIFSFLSKRICSKKEQIAFIS